MDYILSKIQERTNLHATMRERRTMLELYRLQVEYACIFLLGYFWNKNISKIDEDDREHIFQVINRPTIGTVVEVCRTLDIEQEFFGERRCQASLNKYPSLRNQKISHGFLFDDGLDVVEHAFKDLLRDLFTNPSILAEKFDLVLVTGLNAGQHSGIRFNSDGHIHPWLCREEAGDFQSNNVYAAKGVDNYFRLTPFIEVTRDEEFFLFRNVSDRMLGRATYNQLLKTGSTTREWTDFADDVSNDGVRRKSVNGTILNVYQNNYATYIDIGTKNRIKSFLLKNKASVCATIWGHGGVGKTATVQSVCEDLSRSASRNFDYIIFASAKDRAFNFYSGAIFTIDEPIDSFSSLLKCINATIGCIEQGTEQEVVDFGGRLLLVVDDYETFPASERAKIESFIRSLNINHHKVLLTTRANVIIGEEFPTHELPIDDTIRFLSEVMRSEFPQFQVPTTEDFEDIHLRQSIFRITSGRPLFIFQFAHILAQSGGLHNAIRHDIKNREDAIEFLYGRIFNYLCSEGRDLFCAIGLLVTESDLSNLINKLRFITNMESDDDRFNRGMGDLVKLRIVEVFENDFFRVYSKEILEIMVSELDRAPASWRGNVNGRLLQVTRDKKLDTEQALLENANAARYSRTEREVVNLYRQILNRDSGPQIHSQAILNLTDHLFNYCSKKDTAIDIFKDYEHKFVKDASVMKMYANYCWAERKRREAVRILMILLTSRETNWKSSVEELEIVGLCLTYKSITEIEQKDQIKIARNMREVSESAFATRSREIRQEFRQIHDRLGMPLFRQVKESGLGRLSSAARQNAVTGLYHFSGVCIRLDKYDTACEVCDFALQESRSFLVESFQKRKEFALSLKAQKGASRNRVAE